MTTPTDSGTRSEKIVPNSGTMPCSPLADALFGRVQGLILALFFGHPELLL